jgi:hypothetical protein
MTSVLENIARTPNAEQRALLEDVANGRPGTHEERIAEECIRAGFLERRFGRLYLTPMGSGARRAVPKRETSTPTK